MVNASFGRFAASLLTRIRSRLNTLRRLTFGEGQRRGHGLDSFANVPAAPAPAISMCAAHYRDPHPDARPELAPPEPTAVAPNERLCWFLGLGGVVSCTRKVYSTLEILSVKMRLVTCAKSKLFSRHGDGLIKILVEVGGGEGDPAVGVGAEVGFDVCPVQ